MVGQKISIHLQNVIGYLEFLMGHPSFWHNPIYKPFFVFNQNEYQVYNEMYTGEW